MIKVLQKQAKQNNIDLILGPHLGHFYQVEKNDHVILVHGNISLDIFCFILRMNLGVSYILQQTILFYQIQT